MTNYAAVETKVGPLNNDGVHKYACDIFGLNPGEVEAIVGRYTKGKYKGQLRGTLTWKKVTKGGWLKAGNKSRVVYPGHRYDHAIVNVWDNNKILWNEDRRRRGYIPGETEEQYKARHEQAIKEGTAVGGYANG